MPTVAPQTLPGAGDQLTDQQLGLLHGPTCEAFLNREGMLFTIVHNVANFQPRHEIFMQRGLRAIVEDIFVQVNALALMVPLLGKMLENRPGNPELRTAIGAVRPDILSAVSDLQFQIASSIDTLLDTQEAAALRHHVGESKSRADELKNAKSLHDILHTLQQLMPTVKRLASDHALFGIMMAQQVVMLRREVERAIQVRKEMEKSSGLQPDLEWTDDLALQAAALEGSLSPINLFAAQAAASNMSLAIDDAMPAVDYKLLSLARALAKPLREIADLLAAVPPAAPGLGDIGDLISECLDYLQQLRPQIESSITEHGQWQKLDRRFELIGRSIFANDGSAVTALISAWPGISAEMSRLCNAALAQPWAKYLAEQATLCDGALTSNTAPPLPSEVCERLSDLIARGRLRFIEVDKTLLNDLQKTADDPPRLITMLAARA